MSRGRLVFCSLLIAGAIGVALVTLPAAIHSLHPFSFQPLTPPAHAHHRRRHLGHHRHMVTPIVASPTVRTRVRRHAVSGGGSTFAPVEQAGRVAAIAVVMIVMLALMLTVRRGRRRYGREYGLYELHLSTHDQAKGQDLEDMIETIANTIRVWPAERIRNGQPYIALELICGTAPTASDTLQMEWSINVRCEPRSAKALDGAISATYPDVRLGRIHGEQPLPRAAVLRQPGHVMRFRKERSFIYSLIANGEEQASSPLEQIARTQVAVDAPTVVRFQLTPTSTSFEGLARRLYRRHENKLVRQEHWGLPESGLTSTFNRAEMHAAERTQNRSLFWLETVVAADDPDVCKTVAAAVQSRRGENRLHRRWMTIRQRLYQRRFPRAIGPLIPSFRTLVSAAEVAHLLALPSARMKGVPVRRITIPRIPAPPEVIRASRARHSRRAGDGSGAGSGNKRRGGEPHVDAAGVRGTS